MFPRHYKIHHVMTVINAFNQHFRKEQEDSDEQQEQNSGRRNDLPGIYD